MKSTLRFGVPFLLFAGCGYDYPQGEFIKDERTGPHTGIDYQVNIYIPEGYESETEGLPLLFALDGDIGFNSLARLLEEGIAARTVSPAVILGVGNSPWRGLDLTPTAEYGEPSGGLTEFRAWIQTVLVPEVEEEYGVGGAPENRVFTGHSYGGLARVWTLFEAHDFWGNFAATSPSLWWDDQISFEMEEAYFADSQELPANLYLSVGAIEVTPMNIDFDNFVALLDERDYADLTVTSKVFYGDEHYSSF